MADHENKTILLRQLEAERDRLQAEARALDQSMSTRDASLDMIRSVERVQDPIAVNGGQDNPWVVTAAAGSNGCCTIS